MFSLIRYLLVRLLGIHRYVALGRKRRITLLLISVVLLFETNLLNVQTIEDGDKTQSRFTKRSLRAVKKKRVHIPAKEILNFPSNYHAKGVLSLPYGNIVEPFEAWYSGQHKLSRIDYYGGMDRTYQKELIGEHGFACKIVPEYSERTQRNYRGCLHRHGTKEFPVKAQSIVPTPYYFKYIKDVALRGHHSAVWQHEFKVFNKVNTYVLYTTKTKPLKPLRYEMMGYDTLLSSYYDHYVLDYDIFESWNFDRRTLEIPMDLNCFDYSSKNFASTVGELNPMLEFLSHSDDRTPFTLFHLSKGMADADERDSLPSDNVAKSTHSDHLYSHDGVKSVYGTKISRNLEESTSGFADVNTDRTVHDKLKNTPVEYKETDGVPLYKSTIRPWYGGTRKKLRNFPSKRRNRFKNALLSRRQKHRKRFTDLSSSRSKDKFRDDTSRNYYLRPRDIFTRLLRSRNVLHSRLSAQVGKRILDGEIHRRQRLIEAFLNGSNLQNRIQNRGSWKSFAYGNGASHHNYEGIVDNLFRSFKNTHKKSYNSIKENESRKDIYRHNLRFIRSRNRMHLGYKLRSNHFMDMTDDELHKHKGLLHDEDEMASDGGSSFRPITDDFPREVDWRKLGAVNSVTSQGICGSCYAYAATGALEGAYFTQYGYLPNFSEQEIIDCSWGFGNRGCKGGYPHRAMKWIMKHGGLAEEHTYGRYLAQEGYCHFKNVSIGVKLHSYMKIAQRNATELKQAIAQYGPVTVLINTRPKSFKFYSSGIYYDPECSGSTLDHAALAVGYGVEKGIPYWLIKNSWSRAWGESGYIKIAERNNNCGVTSRAIAVRIH